MLAAIAVLSLVYCEQVHTRWLPPCPFHWLTGLDCPGCGSTRALHALLHGHWLKALDLNVMFIPALLMVGIRCAQPFSGKARLLWQRVNRPNVVLMVVLCFWILRNLPFEPFLWLSAGH